MFSDHSSEPVGFTSQLSCDKSEKTADIQTDDIVYKLNETQTAETKNVETQTTSEQKKKPQVDYQKLATFLKRVTPGILEELDDTYRSNALDGYDPGAGGEPTSNVQLLTKLNTLRESSSKTKISDITWSTGGRTLVLSHSIVYHETWCDHLTEIQFYNLTRDDQFPATTNKTLELNACVTALSYCPSEPSIIAAGLFNGDVLLWNLKDEESIIPLQVCVHGDTVSVVHWRPRTLNNASLLVTASKDGYILIYKLMANFTTVRLHKRFKIAKEYNLAESSRPRSAGGSRERAAEAGLSITSLDFSSKDPTLFVIGTLCGGLYKCSIDQATPIEGDDNILDPVVDEYERHEGSVTCVSCSPTRNLFITSGTDKEIRIFDFAQSGIQHVISVESTVMGLTWYIGNTDIFSAYGASSLITFYNVLNGNVVPNIKLESTDRESTCCLRFNSKRDMVAIGDARGNLEIWRIPRHLMP